MRAATLLALASTILLVTTFAGATNISFVPASSGILSGSTATYGVITATSYYWTGSAWSSSNTKLFGRNDGSGTEQGLGVCSPNEIGSSSCYASGTGGGEINELSNENQQELIALTLSAGYTWQDVQVSSLDINGSAPFEHGMFWSSNTSTPSGSVSSHLSDAFLCKFTAGNPSASAAGSCTISNAGTHSPTFSFSGAGQTLFFVAYDWQTSGTVVNNDYLIRAADIATIPEPASMMLLGSGLVGIGGLLRRRFHK